MKITKKCRLKQKKDSRPMTLKGWNHLATFPGNKRQAPKIIDAPAKLKREKNWDKLREVEAKSAAHSKAAAEKGDKYLKNSKFWGKVGVFEGAGYSSKGMYRSMLDCMMFTKGNKPYCKVCEDHVKKIIMHYAE